MTITEYWPIGIEENKTSPDQITIDKQQLKSSKEQLITDQEDFPERVTNFEKMEKQLYNVVNNINNKIFETKKMMWMELRKQIIPREQLHDIINQINKMYAKLDENIYLWNEYTLKNLSDLWKSPTKTQVDNAIMSSLGDTSIAQQGKTNINNYYARYKQFEDEN